jgi:hypothetical protein
MTWIRARKRTRRQGRRLIWLPLRTQSGLADTRICRNECFVRTHIYARNGILTHARLTLLTIAAEPLIALVGNQIADYRRVVAGVILCQLTRISSRYARWSQ